jgi:DNA modification methylase
VTYYADDQVTLHHGDCVEVMATMPESSIDAVCTDPPYGLEFMGRDWDSFKPADSKIRTRVDGRTNGAVKSTVSTPESYRAGQPFQGWCELWATECLRVLKPGGHMLAFGGTRTWHRLMCAIEDAGFEIRDSIAWLYGSGFPKSLDVSNQLDKMAGAEREFVGQRDRYRDGALRQNRGATGGADDFLGLANGVADITAPATDAAKQWQGWGTALKPAFEPIIVARKPFKGTVAANVLEHGTGALNIDACRVASADKLARPFNDAGNDVYGKYQRFGNPVEPPGRWPTNVVLDGEMATELDAQSGTLTSGGGVKAKPGSLNGYCEDRVSVRKSAGIPFESDSGGASRFFPVFKYTAKAPGSERPQTDGIAHPTVKPLDLMRWLIRLVTPPGGVVLDPFAGSGTTGEAAIHEHKRAILIEREASYLPLIKARLHKPMEIGFDFEEPA